MKTKTVFFCRECGNETAKWSGRCPACGAWNTLEEAAAVTGKPQSAAVKTGSRRRELPRPISELDEDQELRFSTCMSELDRVLG